MTTSVHFWQDNFGTKPTEFPCSSFYPTIKNKLVRGFQFTANIVRIVGLETLAAIVTAVVLHLIFPPLAPCFYGLAAATLLTRLVVKVIDYYNVSLLRAIKIKAMQLVEKFTYLQIVVLAVAMVAGCFLPVLGCIIASILGIYNGLITDMLYYKKIQNINENKNLGYSWLH